MKRPMHKDDANRRRVYVGHGGVAAFGTLIQDIQVSGHCLEDVYV
jgi:hypothetical protein